MSEETEEIAEVEEVVEETTEQQPAEETKVLLSGDGDDGADADVPEVYEYKAPEGVEIDEGNRGR